MDKIQPPKPARAKVLWPVWALATAALVALAIFAGYSLRPRPPATVQLVAGIRDGESQIALTADGRLTGAPLLPGADADLVTDALTTHRLPESTAPPVPNWKVTHPGTTPHSAFELISPVDEVTLQIPEFHWQPLPGATSYQVFIYDANSEVAAESRLLTDRSWTVNRPLSTEDTYTWIVKATTPGGVVESPNPLGPNARFTVTDPVTAGRIASTKETTPPLHLLLAALYARSGMTSLARAELTLLQQQNPNSPLVRDLVNSLPPATR